MPAAAQEPVWRYTVRPGDTIWDLSHRLLIDWRRWPEVQSLNGIDEPRLLQPGSRLALPVAWLRLDPASATLAELLGEVTVLRGGGPIEVARGDALRIGDELVTGENGSAMVRFADGSSVVVGAGSRLVLDQLSQYRHTGMVDTRLRLERGRLETSVMPPEGPGSNFEVRTPPATSSVRGTDLRVGLDDAATRSATEVLIGSVQVAAEQVARTVPAGFGTTTRQGEPPAPPRELLDPPPIEAVPARLERLPLRLPLPEVEGAGLLRFGLATEPGFRTLLVDVVGAPGEAVRLELDDGSYAARLRGIDSDGIEGEDLVWTLEIDARPEPPAPTAPRREGRVRDARPEFAWAEPLGARAYRIHLAREAAFAPPLLERELDRARFVPDEDLALGRWYWRLRTIDESGDVGPWGEVEEFERVAPPAEPGIEDLEVERDRVAIRLPALEPGQALRFQLARDPRFEELILDRQVTEPLVEVPGLMPDAYWFRAQIVEADGYVGAFGTPQQITVPPVPWWPLMLVPFALLILLL